MKTLDPIARRKNEFALWLLNLEDEKVLQKVEALMEECLELVKPTGPIPDEDLRMIAQGEADIDSGRYLTQGEFREKYARYGI